MASCSRGRRITRNCCDRLGWASRAISRKHRSRDYAKMTTKIRAREYLTAARVPQEMSTITSLNSFSAASRETSVKDCRRNARYFAPLNYHSCYHRYSFNIFLFRFFFFYLILLCYQRYHISHFHRLACL